MTKGGLLRRVLGVAAAVLAAAAAWWSLRQAQARHHWNEAERALDRQDPQSARVHLGHCLSWWRRRLDVHLLAARAARLADQYEEAEEHLTFCEQFPPVQEDWDAVRRERALFQIQQGDYRRPLEFLAPEGAGPHLPMDALDALAHGYAQTFNKSEALKCLRRLVQHDRLHVRGNLLAGTLYASAKYYDWALPFFRNAVEGLPTAFRPRLELAKCLLELGQTREAAAQLQALRQRYPDDPDVLFSQARVHLYRAQTGEAKNVLQELVQSHADHVDALVELGRLEFQYGDPRISLAWLDKAIRLNPDKEEAWDAQARCHERLGQAKEAKRCLQEAARIRHEFGEVMRLALTATQEKLRDANLRFEVANGLERLHVPAKALQWRYCTLYVDPYHQPTHRAMAAFFERSGQPHRAARHRALRGG
jgi:tetratricopeptide (TPR) repeat protein